jgi:hypothetical protein
MKGRVEDIEISAIDHLFRKVSVMATHLSKRTIAQFENFIPKECRIEMVGKLFVHISKEIYPEKFLKPLSPPKPERKRPSNEEALAKVPDLMRQVYAALDETSFMFQRPPLMPEGYLDQKLGEVLAAYVYDLELTHTQSACNPRDSLNAQRHRYHSTRPTGQRDGPQHRVLHFLSADQSLQKNAELNRAKFQQIHHSCEILRRERLPVGMNRHALQICESPLQRRRHPPNVSFFEWEFRKCFQLGFPVPAPHRRHDEVEVGFHVR